MPHILGGAPTFRITRYIQGFQRDLAYESGYFLEYLVALINQFRYCGCAMHFGEGAHAERFLKGLRKGKLFFER